MMKVKDMMKMKHMMKVKVKKDMMKLKHMMKEKARQITNLKISRTVPYLLLLLGG